MNKLFKALIKDGQLALTVIESTEMVNRAIEIHKLSPLSAAALGRTLTVCTFMASGLKSDKDKLSVTVAGDGTGGKITVCGNGKLQMRGSIDNPQADLPLKSNGKLDVSGCVGKHGRLTVVKSMGLKDPYSGSAELVTGEIAEDFTAYYAYSEQIPTAIALGVKIGKELKCVGAGGVIIQALPFASEEALLYGEEIIKSLDKLSTVIEEKGAKGLIKEYFGDIDCIEFIPEYKCLCSREYIEGVLISLGKKELDDIIEKEGSVKVSCQFCEKTYEFKREDVEKLF
ncbi:MAG: Hsp33 family molecular chaperone HslO [Clostridia bacterium]|nr:Hsp33 family molecular chaperone HslO [Clostridia bacterium]